MFGDLGPGNITSTDSETGLPTLLRTMLPVGLRGLMMSACFSATLSTAGSCLMACSGNVVSDILGHIRRIDPDIRRFLRLSQLAMPLLGAA